MDKLLSLSSAEQEKQMRAVCEALNSCSEKSGQKFVHLLHYIANMANAGHKLANLLVRVGGLAALARQVRDAQHVETRAKICRVLGLVANNCSEVDESTNLSEVSYADLSSILLLA